MKLSDAEQKYIVRRSAATISHFQDEGDAVHVLSEIYCEVLPDKSPLQGELMVREALQWLEIFYNTCDEALENPEDPLCEIIAETLAQLSLDKQCKFLERQMDAQRQYPPTKHSRDRLLHETAQWMLRCDVLPVQMDDTAFEALNNVPIRNAAKETVGEEMFLVAAAMVIYAMTKRRELADAPENISLAQTTICVCAEDRLAKLQWAEKTGFLKSSLIKKRIQGLKAAFISSMLASQIAIGTADWLLGEPLTAAVALFGCTLRRLRVTLDNYYCVMGEMIQDEASLIQYREIAAPPVEIVEEHTVQVDLKYPAWPETNQQEAEEVSEIHSSAYATDRVDLI